MSRILTSQMVIGLLRGFTVIPKGEPLSKIRQELFELNVEKL